jgi:hypothetical protein
MDTLLSTLFEATNRLDSSDARQAAVRAALATHSQVDLPALEADAIKEFDALNAKDDAAPGVLQDLNKIVDIIRAVREERTTRTTTPAAGETTATTPPAPGAGAGAGTASPAATTADTTTAPQEEALMDTATASPAGTELVAASAGAPGTTVTLKPADVPMPWQNMPFDHTQGADNSYVITAAAGGPGVEAGEQFTDIERLTKILTSKFEAFSRGLSEPSQMTLASARPEDWNSAYSNISRSGIASLGFSRQHDFVMEHQHDWQTIERACNERRLPGGSLTPAPDRNLTAAPGTPGWCAPCETRYDFAPPAVIDGIVDLPTVIATRGCLTFPTMPDFGLMYSQLGFCYPASDYDLTENPDADPEANPYWAKNKPCTPVPCPDTQTCTLDPCGVCLQSSILVERAYPELISYFMTNALVAWGHRVNCRDIGQMIAKSTALSVPRAETGPGATASVLEVIDFYAMWLRYKYRLGREASIEVLLPDWVKGVVRADLSKRMGIDLLNVTDQLIAGFLATRKVRAQFVLGLDEAFCDPTVTGGPPRDPKTSTKFGGGRASNNPLPPLTLWPDNVSMLMYPAGTFFRARMNLVNIEGGLVDSALLKRNERLLLFVEEASVVCKRAYDSLYITLPICPSGQAGAGSISQPGCETLLPPTTP